MGGAGWVFSWAEQDDRQSIATIHRAVELGINWVDTAPVYGFGHSEDLLGEPFVPCQKPIGRLYSQSVG